MPTKVKEIIRQIEIDGWFLAATKGSHRQFKHRTKSGRVTVAGKLSDDLSPAMESSIRKQAAFEKVI